MRFVVVGAWRLDLIMTCTLLPSTPHIGEKRSTLGAEVQEWAEKMCFLRAERHGVGVLP